LRTRVRARTKTPDDEDRAWRASATSGRGRNPDGGWANKSEGASRAIAGFDTKPEAQAAGRETARARAVEYNNQRRDGMIGERNSYGNDPHPLRG
jgi:hypothetical protein